LTSILDSMLPDTAYLIEEIEQMTGLKHFEVQKELIILLVSMKVEKGSVDNVMFWWRKDETD